ncbi:hypothetical protein vBEcoMWL3_gp215 [Escherichia phage vB_EcoM_WL-3]|nr:hypothetical protein vBEcoMWL3_gp215 [Escherichia phage vB_EcoM_WL-3]
MVYQESLYIPEDRDTLACFYTLSVKYQLVLL